MHMWIAVLDHSQLAYIYKISLSKKPPKWLAKIAQRHAPAFGALTVSNMLLLGFIQAKKKEPSHPRRHIYKDNGRKKAQWLSS